MREQRAFREMTEALRRVRKSRNEKSGARRRGHPASSENSSVFSDAEYEMVEDGRQEETGQTFFELENRGFRLLRNARLSREEPQMVLAGTRNDTEYPAIVHSCVALGMTKTSVTETEEARALEMAARFILPKLTQNGMLNRLRTVSRVMPPS